MIGIWRRFVWRDKKVSNCWRKDVKSITIGKDEKKLPICDNDIVHIDERVFERKEIRSKCTWETKVGMHNTLHVDSKRNACKPYQMEI